MSLTLSDHDLVAGMARAARVVEDALDTLVPEVDGPEGRLAEAMRYATLGGGKRMRAFLVMEGAALFDVSETLRRAGRRLGRDAARLFAGA